MKTWMRIFCLLFITAIVELIGLAPYGCWSGPLLTVAGAADSSFTQADRDRMTRLEEGLKAINQRLDDNLKAVNQKIDDGLKSVNQKIDDGLKAVNQRIDDSLKAINQKFDDLRGLMYVILSLLGVILSGMFVLVGFILWDRRTTLAPVVRTTRELEDRTERLELVLKEKAAKDPELKEALRHAGLL
ncbi:MAG: hypothetical protein HQL02_04700 [Nitrospirae bacterium]|nr:hypothetical protein [Nitrospirota bacterium]